MADKEYSDYRVWLRDRLAQYPKRGRGKSLELAKRLRIHPTVVSQVFAGVREFSEEQSLEVAEFFDFTEHESRLFRLLVRLANANSPKLKAVLKDEIARLRQERFDLSKQLKTDKKLSEIERAIFYSSWLYSAIRLYCATIKGGALIEDIATHFGISRTKAMSVMDFLVANSLCEKVDSRYKMGSRSTYVEVGSPFLDKHHSNWRMKALQNMDRLQKEELMFTAPFSVSKADFQKLREKLSILIQEFSQAIEGSDSEEVACLNIDFFLVRK